MPRQHALEDLAEHAGFRKLLLQWYRIIETNGTIDNGPAGPGNEINHG